MAITYNKQMITKDRRVMSSGPRDRQLKQKMQRQMTADNSGLIEELRNQIAVLQDRPASTQQGGFSAEQVNDEIIKAIKEETADLKKQHVVEKTTYNKKISKLEEDLYEAITRARVFENDIKNLKEKISEKDEFIEELKSRGPVIDNNVTTLLAEATKKIEALSVQVAVSNDIAVVADSDRPQMETVFVDPIDKESKVEKYFEVEVEDVSITKKEEIGSKVDKLKSLLGKLPTKR